MALEALMQVRDGKLVPATPADAEALCDLTPDATYRTVFTQVRGSRSLSQNALAHKVFAMMAENTDCGLTAEHVKQIVKLESGLWDVRQLPDGTLYRAARSVAFNAMSSAEFSDWLNRPGGAWDAIARKFGDELSASARREIERMVNSEGGPASRGPAALRKVA